LVRDQAHILLGAAGDHVGKIQAALAALDDARIDDADLSAKTYGRSTASAVLAYKKKRRIINFSYQTQADDIVGKMTIAALDTEMAAYENRSLRRPSCGDPVGATAGGVRGASPASLVLQSSPAVAAPAAGQQFPADLDILWQATAAAVKRAAHRHLFLIPKANEILRPLGMEVISSVTSFPDVTLANNDVVDPRFQSDTWRVRKDSEKQRPGFPKVLRVIVCPFDPGSPAFGVTDGGTLDGQTFPFFILLNANKLREDRCTLLHEMIHAATGLGEGDHDPDPDSVFSVGSNRSVLKPEHAQALSKAFFARPKSP
jgi:hypothetical protein